MNWRIAYYVLCALVLAGIVHICVVLLVPAYGTRDAYAVISRQTDPFAFRQIDAAAGDTALSDVDPFFSYGICRYELSQVGLHMQGPKIDSFWSASILDDNGTIIYSLNSRTAIDNRLDLILLDPVQILRLREAQPQEAESAIVVEADVRAGFVVLRVLSPDESWAEKSAQFLRQVHCRPYVPGEAPPEPVTQ